MDQNCSSDDFHSPSAWDWISNVDPIISYNESKKAKDEINIIKIENEKVNDDLQLKIEEIFNCKEALSKLKLSHEKLENKLKDAEQHLWTQYTWMMPRGNFGSGSHF